MMNYLQKKLSRLNRENNELLETITRICMHLNFPTPQNWLLQEVQIHENLISQEIIQIHHNLYVDYSENHSENLDDQRKIAELTALLQEKQTELSNKQNNIEDYIENAKNYEDQLQRNEEEKVKLLQQFQEGNNTSSIHESKEVLEAQIHILIEENNGLRNNREQIKQQLEDAYSQLNQSHEKHKMLKEQLDSFQSELSGEQNPKESQLIQLRKKIKKLDNEIEKWKNYNKELEEVL